MSVMCSCALLLLLGHVGNALNCYECYDAEIDSDDDSVKALAESMLPDITNTIYCRDNRKDDSLWMLVECRESSSLHTRCGKLYFNLDATYEGVAVSAEYWSRGCFDHTVDAVGCSEDFSVIMQALALSEYSPDGTAEACLCDRDRCNMAVPTVSASITAFLLPILITCGY